jgi:hypothetical protein
MLSKNVLNQIYSIASTINDEWTLSDTTDKPPKNPLWKVGGHAELIVNKKQLSSFENLNRILQKMQFQYKVLAVIADPYDDEDEEYGDNYAFIISPEFDEFYKKLHKAVKNSEEIDDTYLTPMKSSLCAELLFIGFGRPAVRIKGKVYEYSSMQYNGLPFTIVEHCLENHPNQVVNIEQLTSELGAERKPKGVDNITETMRKSPLFGEHGILSFFIETTPNSIKVNNKLIFPSLVTLNMLTLPAAKDESIQRLLKVMIDKEFRKYIQSKSSNFSE